jgi:hypothetical protein
MNHVEMLVRLMDLKIKLAENKRAVPDYPEERAEFLAEIEVLERKLARCIIVFLLLLCPTMLSAQPNKPWYKDKKVWFVIAHSVGSSIAATHEAHQCRLRFGPAPCDGGYGEFRAREWVRFGSSIGLTALSLWGRHQDIKVWAAPSTAFSSYNTSVAVRQARIGCPAGQHFLEGTKFTCVTGPSEYPW